MKKLFAVLAMTLLLPMAQAAQFEEGKHYELIAKAEGHYKNLYESQFAVENN